MLSERERRLLVIFRQFRVGPGEMLCLNSQQIKTHRTALNVLLEKGYLVPESFSGAYSLTRDGFSAMKKGN